MPGNINYLYFIAYSRHDTIHVHPVSFDSGNRHVGFHWTWHRILWMRNGPQRLRVAEGKNLFYSTL